MRPVELWLRVKAVKGTFNATCDICKQFRPRCAVVVVSATRDRDAATMTLCEGCRRAFRNSYRLDARHKREGQR